MTTRVSEAVARPLRTAPQGGLAWAITEGVDAFFWNMDERQYGVAIVLLTIIISFIQTTIEDGLGKAILRDVPDASPVVGDEETPNV